MVEGAADFPWSLPGGKALFFQQLENWKMTFREDELLYASPSEILRISLSWASSISVSVAFLNKNSQCFNNDCENVEKVTQCEGEKREPERFFSIYSIFAFFSLVFQYFFGPAGGGSCHRCPPPVNAAPAPV